MAATDTDAIRIRRQRYVAELARSPADVRATLALRYHVFAEEMGAQLHSRTDGLDYDEFDDYCDHLLVREVGSGKIVACTRLLSDSQAAKIGRYYSEGEFNINRVLSMSGRFLEIGRTCVDPAHRGSVVIGTLWNGLAEYVFKGRFNYLMGCASISPGPSGFAVDAVYSQLDPAQIGPSRFAVQTKKPVPSWQRCVQDESGIPPLLQAYLRLGCWVCGEPYWDEDFNVMDVFILLDLTRLQSRYERRFIHSKVTDAHASMA